MKKVIVALVILLLCMPLMSSKIFAEKTGSPGGNPKIIEKAIDAEARDLNVEVTDATESVKAPVTTSTLTWVEVIGGDSNDYLSDAQPTSDGGYIVCGRSSSKLLVMKLASNDSLVWSKTYQSASTIYPNSMIKSYNGNYVIIGRSYLGSGVYGFVIIEIDSNGNLISSKSISGIASDSRTYIQQTTDHGYIISGTTSSSGAGGDDFLLVKLDSSGTLQWVNTYGGGNDDISYSVLQTKDSGYILTGYTYSFGAGGYDFFLVKIDSNGDLQWGRTYGGSSYDYGKFAYQTSDGSYIVTGNAYYRNIIIMKLTPSGDMVWKNSFDEGYCGLYSLQPTNDGGYVISGYVDNSSLGTKSDDAFLLKINSSGEFQWEKIFNGNNQDYACSAKQLTDGGYIAVGDTSSFGAGGYDCLAMKLGPNGNVCETCGYYIKGVTPAVSNPDISASTNLPVVVKSASPSSGTASINVFDIIPEVTVICQGEIITLPTAPQNLTASALSNSISLSWNASTQGTYPIAGYAIYRGIYSGGEDINPIATVGASVTTFADTIASPGITYYYYVKAFDNQTPPNYSMPSSEASATLGYSSVTVSVTPGKFNLLANPFPVPILLSIINTANGEHIEEVYSFDWTNKWVAIEPSAFSTTYLQPGRGYWIKLDSSASSTFIYPKP